MGVTDCSAVWVIVPVLSAVEVRVIVSVSVGEWVSVLVRVLSSVPSTVNVLVTVLGNENVSDDLSVNVGDTDCLAV